MSLKLIYITNDPQTAIIAEHAGVNRIMIDLESLGKEKRQAGLDTVKSHHSIEDILSIKQVIENAEIIVRCNPVHQGFDNFISTEQEIEQIVKQNVDIIMLPYFKTVQEVKTFIDYVDGQAKTMLLVETPEAVENIDNILEVPGIDEIYIGLNDLSLGYGYKFMFQPLSGGLVEKLALKFKEKGLNYGFGGIASIGNGLLPAEKILKEHYRLGSSSVILSRSFYNPKRDGNITEKELVFKEGVEAIRVQEREIEFYSDYFRKNSQEIKAIVNQIIGDQ